MLTRQSDQYKDSDHKIWSILYSRLSQTVKKIACRQFILGLEELAFSEKNVPEFTAINKRLMELTGWQIYAVPGLLPDSDFFEGMFHKEFGATTRMRKMKEPDYLEEPDLFHDVFGHIPLLTDPFIAQYLQQLAKLAVKYITNEQAIEAVARLYWYTIEFGLVKEDNEVKIYGARILSSVGETNYCLSPNASRVSFNLEEVIQTSYIKDEFQEKYFVLESFEQLSKAVKQFDKHLESTYPKKEIICPTTAA
jgi:phenylalanine-4-hydroxylase